MKLCCFFNYAPHYRASIYKKIDDTFDTQFFFGEEVEGCKNSGIKKIDYNIFKNKPIEFKNRLLFKRILWRQKLLPLAFSKKYDTFLLTGDFCYTYIPFIILCKLFGKRTFAWGHGLKTRNSKTGFLRWFQYKYLDGYFSYGDGGKKRLIELGADGEKIHVIYNSLVDRISPQDNENLKSDIYKKYFNNENPVILFIGRLTSVKRLDWILRAQHEGIVQNVPYNVVFIGDGSERALLKKLSQELGLERFVWFYGECYSGAELSRLIYNADLCCSPGNVGLTALHAMQFGLPVISHDDFETQMPEYETIIPEVTGDLYEYGSFESYSNAVIDWIRRHNSDREQIRQNCYRQINAHFNSGYQIDLLKNILLQK